MHLRYTIEDFSFLSKSRFIFIFYLVTKSMTVKSLKIQQASVRARNFPLLCNMHQVRYRTHSSQPYIPFFIYRVTVFPVYYAREIKYFSSTVLLLISEHRLEEDERPCSRCSRSSRFILYGIPNHAVICLLLYSNNEVEN